ncbi:MAG: hypothetical protein GY839_04830 [candidate division Zixibacteria bacterium]|nr:hypothetical protein [candidate division Zixibacteria bacterium]
MLSTTLLIVMFAFAAIYIFATIRIVIELQKRDYKINFLLIKVLIFKYLNQYKKITTEETGSPGQLYYVWVYSVLLMAIFAFGVIATV